VTATSLNDLTGPGGRRDRRASGLGFAMAKRFVRDGAVRVLCNNAGVVKSGRAWKRTQGDWQWVLGVAPRA
jgi:NAD(P)-dependent dehydrogenase (short-subunit alcohol dehydrogenase family)